MSDWLPEYDNALRAHLQAGCSHREAAAEINATFMTEFSRNAAIGRSRRQGFPSRNTRKDNRQHAPKPKRVGDPILRPKTAHRKVASAPKLGAVSFVPRPDPRPGAVPLLELVPDGCRYPNGDSVPYFFCNQPTSEGSYCAEHAAICFRAPEPRRR